MANFPSIAPIFNAQKNSAPKIRVARFGDGYEQRVTFGIHQNPKRWDLIFMVTDANASTIETFLDARAADCASFDWTPPDDSTSYKWVCEQWAKEVLSDNFNRITATFRQVFEP